MTLSGLSADELFRVGERAATLTAQLIALECESRHVGHIWSVQTVFADLHSMIVSLLPDHIELIVQVDEQVAYVEVDREGLETVLLQLVVNARDAMPNGGRLTIEITTIEDLSTLARPVSINTAHSQILIQISDTGTAMSLDTQAHMFEPLFSTKETNIGLGLTAVFGIVKQNCGLLDVESRPETRDGCPESCSLQPRRRRSGTRRLPKLCWPKEMKRSCLWRKAKSSGSWHGLSYSAIAIESWRRPHRSRRLCSLNTIRGLFISQ